jgi:hypothetical protein
VAGTNAVGTKVVVFDGDDDGDIGAVVGINSVGIKVGVLEGDDDGGIEE